MVDAFCKTWKLTKPPQDEAARIALSNSWGTGCSKPAAECQEVPTFRLKRSCKNKAQYYLIQRRGSKRNVIGPVTMDGKPSVIKRNCCYLFKTYECLWLSIKCTLSKHPSIGQCRPLMAAFPQSFCFIIAYVFVETISRARYLKYINS